MVFDIFVCKPSAVICLNTFSQLRSQTYLISNLTGRVRESFMRHKNSREAEVYGGFAPCMSSSFWSVN